MITTFPGFKQRMALRMANDTTITMRWVEWAAGVETDPTTGARLGDATPMSTTFKGFVHFANATSSIRNFREIEIGDAIVDIPPETAVDGKEGVIFEIGGERYVPKDMPDSLAHHWDSMVMNQKVCRTLLLRKSG